MNSFQVLLGYLKTSSIEADKGLPAFDKLPTNAFLEGLFEQGEEPEPSYLPVDPSPDQNASDTKSEARRSSRKASSTTRSAKLRAIDRNVENDEESVLDCNEEIPAYDDTGQRAYEKACDKFKALRISSLCRQLKDSTCVNIQYYNAGPESAKAIAIPMVINSRVTALNLAGNDLTPSGLSHIIHVLYENDFITNLNLSDNGLKTEGAKQIASLLLYNHNIEVLDISNNGFSSSDANILMKPMENHSKLRILNLANNKFGDDAGSAIKSLLAECDTLQELDLSWNQLRHRGITDIAKGLKDNITLKKLDLSWNGCSDKGCQALGPVLSSSALMELGLNCTRVGAEGVVAICRTFADNQELKILRLGQNPLPESFVVAALDFFLTLDELHLEELDLSDVTFSSRFKDKIAAVTNKHSRFSCIHGYSHSYGKRKLAGYSAVGEAMRAIRTYCDHHGINIVELFSRFDADGSMSVSHDEFREGLKEARIPISNEQISLLIQTFDQDGDGEIDFSEMVLGAEIYKN